MNYNHTPHYAGSFSITRNHYGDLSARTRVMLDDTKELEVRSYKNDRKQLVTVASVSHLEGNARTFVLFQDMNETIVSLSCSRMTEKLLASHHAALDIELIITRARALYKLP